MKIVSFGDSFVYGTELANNDAGNQSWIALAAGNIGVDYETLAVPGCGNENISQQVLTYFANNPVDDTLAVINWTWSMRWDVYFVANESWTTIGPSCVPSNLQDILPKVQAQQVIDFYNTFAGNSMVWDRYRTLQTMLMTQQYLAHRGVTSVQTYMDHSVFDQEYHAPNYIQELQRLVQKPLETFDGKNFLDWSRDRGYAITQPWQHPLEDAHQAASKLWQSRYAHVLGV